MRKRMTTPMPDQRPRPSLGRAIVRTAAERDRLVAITADDVLRARLWWPGVAPAGFEGLIEARVETPKGTT
jgi:hypothetical protein